MSIAFYLTISKNKTFLFCLIGILFSVQIYSKNWLKRDDPEQKNASLYSLNAISELIASETSWRSEEFNQRVYWVGIQPESSPAYVYESHQKKHPGIPRFTNSGYIVIHKRALNLLDLSLDFDFEPIWRTWIKNSKIIITSKREIFPYTILTYKVINETLPISIQNTGLPNDVSSRYLEVHRNFDQYNIPTFHGKGPEFYLLYDKQSEVLTFFSEETSRFVSMGPTLYIESARLDYLCDQQKKTIELPPIGIKLGTPRSDVYRGMAHPQSYLKSTIYTPLLYKLKNCQIMKPVQFSASEIWYYNLSQPSSKRRYNNFEYNF